jgi:hypothetical protein
MLAPIKENVMVMFKETHKQKKDGVVFVMK